MGCLHRVLGCVRRCSSLGGTRPCSTCLGEMEKGPIDQCRDPESGKSLVWRPKKSVALKLQEVGVKPRSLH